VCGIAGIFGPGLSVEALRAMVASQRHRGPDAEGIRVEGGAGLGHGRLAVLDLSDAGRQPMDDGRYRIVLNGEIYNYRELREELSGEPFRTGTDTEVALRAFRRWGEGCLDRFVGMFALLVWDAEERRLFGARDRFGVKPLHYAFGPDGTLLVASEIKALHAAGVPRAPDAVAWASYLAHGGGEGGGRTFFQGVFSLPPGGCFTFAEGLFRARRWYDLAAFREEPFDPRPEAEVAEELLARLEESVRLRFRADVPVGICLSGGLDSSTLLGLVRRVQGEESEVRAYTFACGDPSYDETPYVEAMVASTRHPLSLVTLEAAEVPRLAQSMASFQDEPFGGVPTLAYGKLFERARAEGTTVLLDGQGMDEAWGGYDYFGAPGEAPVLQGSRERATRPECLDPAFRALAEPAPAPRPFPDALRNLQYRDARFTKLPRALRYNDRASMRASRELREPFLDHRLFELALRQPADRKIRGGVRKRLLRDLAARLCPKGIVEAPKRPVQTPQREWLRGPLRAWAGERIEEALEGPSGAWFDRGAVRAAFRAYAEGEGDNSFFVWQWVSAGLLLREGAVPAGEAR